MKNNFNSYKILVSAYACEPGKGSEPEVGWQWIQQLAKYNEVWVITRKNNEAPILESKIQEKIPNLHFEYYDLPKTISWWKKGGKGIHLYYVIWQIGATFKGLRLSKKIKFDICHHLTFSPFYHPPLFSFLPIPFLWGPLGGGEKLPATFLKLFTTKQKIREKIRRFVRFTALINPLVFFAMMRAKLLIASTKETYFTIPKLFRNKAILELQIGMDPIKNKLESKNESDKFKIITAGRHTYWKGQILAIRAFASFVDTYDNNSEMIILGKGPETQLLKKEVIKLGVANKITFIDCLPEREDVMDAFLNADVFLYASLLECAGYVALEALSQGTPVVCLDLPGPGDVIDETCGVKVSCNNPEDAVENLSKALMLLASDRELCEKLSLGAIEKVRNEQAWKIKGERLQGAISRNLT